MIIPTYLRVVKKSNSHYYYFPYFILKLIFDPLG